MDSFHKMKPNRNKCHLFQCGPKKTICQDRMGGLWPQIEKMFGAVINVMKIIMNTTIVRGGYSTSKYGLIQN